jgi:hypothetical protein
LKSLVTCALHQIELYKVSTENTWNALQPLFDILNELLDYETNKKWSMIDLREDETIEHFMEWWKLQHQECQNLEVKYHPFYGYGLYTIHSIEKDEILMKIERKCMMTTFDMMELKDLRDKEQELNFIKKFPFLQLVLLLLHHLELGDSSFFQPYISKEKKGDRTKKFMFSFGLQICYLDFIQPHYFLI